MATNRIAGAAKPSKGRESSGHTQAWAYCWEKFLLEIAVISRIRIGGPFGPKYIHAYDCRRSGVCCQGVANVSTEPTVADCFAALFPDPDGGLVDLRALPRSRTLTDRYRGREL